MKRLENTIKQAEGKHIKVKKKVTFKLSNHERLKITGPNPILAYASVPAIDVGVLDSPRLPLTDKNVQSHVPLNVEQAEQPTATQIMYK